MPIDASTALSAAPQVQHIRWTRRDVMLYHLSLGAGRHADVDPDLRWTFERDLQVLPTFAMVAGGGPSVGDLPPASMQWPGIDIDLRRVLHGGQKLTVHRPIPPAGSATVSTRVAEIWDKQKAAVIVLQGDATDPDGEPLWTTSMQIWARGEGGFGGEPGWQPRVDPPGRDPDHRLVTVTSPGQALLYRLNGDLNPLHVDPEFASEAGFDRPILHGLASYGIVAKAVVDELLGGVADRLVALDVRFAGTVIPGQTISTAVWREGDELTLVSTCPDDAGAAVLTDATARVRT